MLLEHCASDYIKASVGEQPIVTYDVWWSSIRKWIGPFYSKSQAVSFCNSVNGTKK